MPHLILEYSANLLPAFEPKQALHRMNTVLLASGEFVPDHIKSRALRVDDFLVGDEAPGGFLHASLHLLSGRDDRTKLRLTEGSNVSRSRRKPVTWTAAVIQKQLSGADK